MGLLACTVVFMIITKCKEIKESELNCTIYNANISYAYFVAPVRVVLMEIGVEVPV